MNKSLDINIWGIHGGRTGEADGLFLKKNCIALGWAKMGDLSTLIPDREVFKSRVAETYPEYKPGAIPISAGQLLRFVHEMKPGDLVAYPSKRDRQIHLGRVEGDYHYDPKTEPRFPHVRSVEWLRAVPRTKFSQGALQEIGSAITLFLVKNYADEFRVALDLEEMPIAAVKQDMESFREDEEELIAPEPLQVGDTFFSLITFRLLAGLHEDPTKAYYNANKDALKENVTNPMRELFKAVAQELPDKMRERLETRKHTLANLLKNDYGQGGAYDYHWGAFYPKGSKRTADAQLFISINRTRLQFGFYIGEYGKTQRERLTHNAAKYAQELVLYLPDLSKMKVQCYSQPESSQQAVAAIAQPFNWQAWLQQPASMDYRVTRTLPSDEVLQTTREALVEHIADLFQRLYLLVLLTTLDEPMPAIHSFVEGQLYVGEQDGHQPLTTTEIATPATTPPPPNPPYSLAELAQATYLPQSLLERWVRALHRKGQAILYGPPGTGKTYVAEGLAKHLIGGGNGFTELVQFHPAYTYEDFIQGLRPQAHEHGGLDYPLVAGRFLEFCEGARKRDGPCVLIIDEVNRANLARVFGELMYLLEYRGRSVPLAGGGQLSIPENVRLVGTMNTADRSIALVDHALRRRFAFLPLYPNYDVLQQYHADTGFPVQGLINTLRKLNTQIADTHYEVGISYFLCADLSVQIEDIWRMEIEPYLEEYFFDQPEKVKLFQWEQVHSSILA